MIKGQVVSSREGIVDDSVMGNTGAILNVPCVLDTSFSGYLTLHPDEIEALELLYAGNVEIELGNGRIDTTATFEGRVDWEGLAMHVVIQESLGSHLLGMHLLSGCTLTMDISPNGMIAIEPETCAPFD